MSCRSDRESDMSGAPEHPETKNTAIPMRTTAVSRRWVHRIVAPRSPDQRYDPVGRCIYCDRAPPDVELRVEHIIADGLGGDLLLPSASCDDCGKITCRYEQQVLREVFRIPRGALGIRSKKKRPDKQTDVRMRVGLDENLVEQNIPFTAEMPRVFMLFTTDNGPGIARGASPEEECLTRPCSVFPPDSFERFNTTFGKNRVQYGVTLHEGLFGQVIAKTAHAFAVATLGLNQFKPFLTDYIRAPNPYFDGYHLASRPNRLISDAIHEIELARFKVPWPTIIGTTSREVYGVRLRLFANLGTPDFLIIVGQPV